MALGKGKKLEEKIMTFDAPPQTSSKVLFFLDIFYLVFSFATESYLHETDFALGPVTTTRAPKVL